MLKEDNKISVLEINKKLIDKESMWVHQQLKSITDEKV